MATWSGTRKKLENEYLAKSLRGHIQYFATSYSRSPDHEGRAAIYLDSKPVLSGNYYNYWFKAKFLPEDEREDCWEYTEDTNPNAVGLGMFDQRSFYYAFDQFNNQSIEKSLESENIIVRIFAIFDRRVGKRRLKILAENISNQPEIIRKIVNIRLKTENMIN